MADIASPALRLPADVLLVLSEFFRPCSLEIQEGHSVDHLSLTTWASIPAVCREWRKVCLGSPSYWTYLVLPSPHVHPSRILARARDAPLDVYVDIEDYMSTEQETGLAEGLVLLKDRTQQFTSFAMRNHGVQPVRKAMLKILVDILSKPLTQLKYLQFHDGLPPSWGPATAVVEDVALHAAALRNISLQGYHRLNWAHLTTPMNDLRFMHLTFLNFEHMRGALAYLPNLQSAVIDLGECQLARGVEWVPSAKSLHWPSLQDITFHCHPVDAPMFWEALDVPPSVQVTFIVRHHSPYVAAMESRTMLDATLSQFFPIRTGDLIPAPLDALTVTSRHVNREEDPRATLDWYTGGLDAHASSVEDQEARVQIPYTTSIVIERQVTSVVFSHLRQSLHGLESLYLDHADIDGTSIANAVASYLPFMFALRALAIRGRTNTLVVLESLVSTEGEYLPALENITLEEANLTSDGTVELLLTQYLARRLGFEADVRLIDLKLLHCEISDEVKEELSTFAKSIVCI